jgi:hypothetical protein
VTGLSRAIATDALEFVPATGDVAASRVTALLPKRTYVLWMVFLKKINIFSLPVLASREVFLDDSEVVWQHCQIHCPVRDPLICFWGLIL